MINELLNGKIEVDTVTTPENIARDMLGLLPDDVWNKETTFYDPACKSGIFLKLIYETLMEKLVDEIEDEEERRNHILNNQIYGVTSTRFLELASQRTVYGRMLDEDEGNIKYVPNINTLTKDSLLVYKSKIKEAFKMKGEGDLKFDVVIGNPPYNRGMDLDFVNKGFDLAKKYCVMITPAKWQTAADDQRTASKSINYKGFREKIVPYMSKVVFYPACKDIFDIHQHDGIAYFIVNKESKINKCVVENMCKDIEYFNGTQVRDIKTRDSLLNIGNDIIKYLGNYESFQIEGWGQSGKYGAYVGTMPSGFDWFDTKSPRYVLGLTRVVDKENEEDMESLPKSCECVFSSNRIEDCESYQSWLNTRFTRFFLVPNISKMGNILTNDNFRFVPAPPKSDNPWDHIYTDEELYKAFNLKQEHIDVIEAVIKERK